VGTTVTPTLLSAGTTTNTVPAAGRVALDVRAADPAELPRVEADLHAAAARASAAVPGVAVEVTGGVNRPPLDAASSADLFARACRLAGELGQPALRGAAVGGGSDGNFTAGAGVPTLDGLGAVGDGAHAEGEHVLLSAMEPRARLLAALIEELL
jgi:glutamate carboxypeptidase